MARRPDEEQLATWRRGVVLEDGYRTAPVEVRLDGTFGKGAWLRVVMREGRKRQIRETGSQIGLPVVKIIRVRIGSLRWHTEATRMAPPDRRRSGRAEGSPKVKARSRTGKARRRLQITSEETWPAIRQVPCTKIALPAFFISQARHGKNSPAQGIGAPPHIGLERANTFPCVILFLTGRINQ